MLTFLDIYNECAGQPWSMFDNDATSIDDFESAMRISINKALSYLWNLHDWSFRVVKKNMTTRTGIAEYNMPDGNLMRKTIKGTQRYGVKYDGKFLPYEPSYELLDEEEGTPESFYINGEKLCLYPTPDAVYPIQLLYLKMNLGLSKDGEQLTELVEDTDYIDIPEKYETLFKNCLISLSMVYAIAEETDENYSAYQRQYEDALQTLMKYCKDSIVDKNIVW